MNKSIIFKAFSYFITSFRISINKIRAKFLGINFFPPNYLLKGTLNHDSIVFDIGCADNPDLSIFLINKYKVYSFAIDPTQKHFNGLSIIKEKFHDNFIHLPYAISNKTGLINFYESINKDSGSIYKDHINIKHKNSISYMVESYTLSDLLARLNLKYVDYIKLDLEGAEYSLFASCSTEMLKPFNQIFIEFHHHALENFDRRNTLKIVNKISECGFKYFSLEGRNYLFYKK